MDINEIDVDIMLKGMKKIGERIGVNYENNVKLVIKEYMMGLGVQKILYGKLRESLGRRMKILGGMEIYVVEEMGYEFVKELKKIIIMSVMKGIGDEEKRVIEV